MRPRLKLPYIFKRQSKFLFVDFHYQFQPSLAIDTNDPLGGLEFCISLNVQLIRRSSMATITGLTVHFATPPALEISPPEFRNVVYNPLPVLPLPLCIPLVENKGDELTPPTTWFSVFVMNSSKLFGLTNQPPPTHSSPLMCNNGSAVRSTLKRRNFFSTPTPTPSRSTSQPRLKTWASIRALIHLHKSQ